MIQRGAYNKQPKGQILNFVLDKVFKSYRNMRVQVEYTCPSFDLEISVVSFTVIRMKC